MLGRHRQSRNAEADLRGEKRSNTPRHQRSNCLALREIPGHGR